MKGRRVAAAVLAMLFLLAQRAWAVDISATAAVLMDADTGRILYEKNPDRRMLVASTTKILTALVVLENCELRSTVKVTQEHMALRIAPCLWQRCSPGTGRGLRRGGAMR